jgi:hypothetical protein
LSLSGKLAARGISLPPPLDVSVVEAFERRCGVVLPDEYRDFLLRVGNGGPGPPAYGLLPLGEAPPRNVPNWFSGRYEETLRRPFPLTEYWVWENEWGSPDLEARISELQNGALCLGTDGCAMYWFLIVTGPERGQMWWVADVGVQPLAPRRTFGSWYEAWLDGDVEWWREFEHA